MHDTAWFLSRSLMLHLCCFNLNRIIVGAPKQDRSGAVMACDIFSQPRLMSQSSCQKLPFFDSFEEQGQGNMTDMWFGVSVSSGQQNGLMVSEIILGSNCHKENQYFVKKQFHLICFLLTCRTAQFVNCL